MCNPCLADSQCFQPEASISGSSLISLTRHLIPATQIVFWPNAAAEGFEFSSFCVQIAAHTSVTFRRFIVAFRNSQIPLGIHRNDTSNEAVP